MAHAHDEMIIPKPALVAAGLLIAVALAMTAAGTAGLYKTPKVAAAEARAAVPVTASRHLVLQARDDGSILVRDPRSDALVRTIAPSEGGFIHYSMTGLRYSRTSHGLDPRVNIMIERYADGRLMVREIDTGVQIDVIGYGPTNLASYSALMTDGPLPQIQGRRQP
jgi:putative photosynthetic complex assembly protein